MLAGVIMIVANIFDFIDGKVAHITGTQSEFGAFWDSTLDRFSDLALLHRPDLPVLEAAAAATTCMVAALTLIFSIMTSYARARAESLVEKCKVGFMERPERIVLFMIGAFTNRMAGVLWVILVLSVVTVANRIYYTYLALNKLPMPSHDGRRRRLQARVLLDRRARDAALRPVGDRDPRVRLAHAARLARRSDRHRPRPARLRSASASVGRSVGSDGSCAADAATTPSRYDRHALLRFASVFATAFFAVSSAFAGFFFAALTGVEALAQRLHQVDDLRRRLDLRRHDLLAGDLASMICRSPSWYSSL